MPLQTILRDLKAHSLNTGPRVLITDQDVGVRRLLWRELRAAGYRVQVTEPAGGLPAPVTGRQFDLLILDIDSAAAGGLDCISAVREVSSVPILALSTRSEEDAMVGALEVGADDYIRKPFSTKELLARVKSALRRGVRDQGKPAKLVSGDLEIDLLYRRVRLGGCDVHLPVKPYEVLRVLAERPGKVLTHAEILDAVWGPRQADRIGYLRLAIQKLRRKLGDDPAHPRYILTEARVGYRLDVRKQA
jgi:two-component system, OmpR family, KDP operon response regulator KdpE